MKMQDIQGLSQEELLNQLASYKKDLADMQRKPATNCRRKLERTGRKKPKGESVTKSR
jgi:ribosomal protein L29